MNAPDRPPPTQECGADCPEVARHEATRRALEENRDLLRTVLDHVPGWLALTDADGRYVVVNRQYEVAFGKRLAEIEGRLWRDVFPELAPVHGPLITRCQAGETVEFDDVLALGPARPTHVHGVYRPVADAAGRLRYLSVIALDITARVAAEDALAAERERLAVTLRSIADGVASTDAVGRVTFLNEAAEQLTGWSAQAAVGRPLAEVFAPLDEKTRSPVTLPGLAEVRPGQPLAGGRPLRLVARDGSERLIAGNIAAVRDRAGDGVVVVFRDVTETTRAEEELRTVERLESVGLLAGGIAHDFNNLLAGIFGNLTLARLELPADSPAVERLEAAERAALRARGLTRQLLTFARGGAPVRRLTRIGPLLADWTTFPLRGARSRAELDIAADLWPVEVDADQLSQVVGNLVLNADQAMPGGGVVTVSARNVPSGELPDGLLPAGPTVEIAVRDQGSGIPAENLRRVFDPYFTTKPSGSGLGLTTCQAIVRKHDGHLRVESPAGEGATFRLYLPALPTETVVADDAAAAAPGRGRVLVMDDDESVRDVCQAMLTRLGYETATVPDGADAIARYVQAREAGRPFDVVLVDLTVPGGMGGQDTARALLAIDAQVRTVAVSGYSSHAVAADCAAYGFRGFVEKPFTVAALARAVRDALA
jgi:PAS domain S-box-containing protein